MRRPGLLVKGVRQVEETRGTRPGLSGDNLAPLCHLESLAGVFPEMMSGPVRPRCVCWPGWLRSLALHRLGAMAEQGMYQVARQVV